MASGSLILYYAGGIMVALAFMAYVAHAVLLANARIRLPRLVLQTAPAYAGVVTGSFVERRDQNPRGVDPGSAAAPFASTFTVVAIALLALSMAMRATIVGRGPWGNLFEYTVAFAFTMITGYWLLSRRYAIRSIGFIPLGVALGLLLYSMSLPNEIEPLVPALQNAPLLTIHVGMATIAYGIFATSFAAGVGYLIQGRTDRFAWLPSHKVLDEVAYRAVIVGFPIFATMIILGSWWASIAWSAYWSWDPKETSALVTWLVYAIYLHARNQRAWAGRPAALLLVVGFLMVLVTYSGSLWFSGLHSYSGLN
ncbi:MAG TPA: cytochrome c biogenesis protein CcsA [Candidatus Saccharimonadales bacterium]|nr:cytochrome c biogenesis protein CcsA [Candidatus Saccharimonadales bacterium]